MLEELKKEVYEANMEPVSYTHLDVYKRQVHTMVQVVLL